MRLVGRADGRDVVGRVPCARDLAPLAGHRVLDGLAVVLGRGREIRRDDGDEHLVRRALLLVGHQRASTGAGPRPHSRTASLVAISSMMLASTSRPMAMPSA